jgi:hypothetical protein
MLREQKNCEARALGSRLSVARECNRVQNMWHSSTLTLKLVSHERTCARTTAPVNARYDGFLRIKIACLEMPKTSRSAATSSLRLERMTRFCCM